MVIIIIMAPHMKGLGRCQEGEDRTAIRTVVGQQRSSSDET